MLTSTSPLPPELAGRLKRDADGLVAAVVQQHDSGEVLMVGWMDDEALHRTLTSGRVTFWSRSRREYWRKGDTSGHVQLVRSAALDCDGDALLVLGTGFLGGYTTFSTAAYETVRLAGQRRWGPALLHGVGQVVAATLLAALGFLAGS